MVRISIIIPTFNEARYIGRTLRAIRRQGFRDIEVILADSNSSDGTVRAAKAAYDGIRVCSTRGRGIGRACNNAVRISNGEIIVFVEGDTVISGGLLAAYDRAFRDRGVVAATGPIRPLEKTTAANELGFKVVSVYLTRLFIALGRPSIIGSNFAVTRKAFDRVHGFNERLVTYQDWDLANRLGKVGRVVFVDDAVSSTSIRRVRKWGAFKYFRYHAANVVRYQLTRSPRDDYEVVR